MSNTVEYKGYIGSVEFSEEDAIFCGKVIGVQSLISYEGKSVDSFLASFHNAIDDYLIMCKDDGVDPEVAFKGRFNVRIRPELHKKIYLYAMEHNMSLNKYVETALENSPAAQYKI